MPFKSKAQWRECYRKKDPDWDCDEFAKESPPYGSLPERMHRNGEVGWENNRLLSQEEWEEEGRTLKPKGHFRYLATFINPVTRRLFDAVYVYNSTTVYLICPEDPDTSDDDDYIIEMGYGNFDQHDEAGDNYRSHSPGGVVEKGVAYGLLLYSGLALLARATYDKSGIFSVAGSGRSQQAADFWDSQVERGYAIEDCESVGYDRTYVQVSIDQDEAAELAKENLEGCDLQIDEIDEEVEVEVGVEISKEVQTLDAYSVMDSGLVLGWNEDSFDEQLADNWKQPPLEILYDLRLDNCFNIETVYLLIDNIREQAGDDFDREKALSMVRTVPLFFFEDPTFQRWYLELAGQTSFDFGAVEASRQKMVANFFFTQDKWKKFYGDIADEAP